MAFQLRSAGAVVLVLGIAAFSHAHAEQTPPKELIQYVREATRRGVAETRIKQQAVALGWPEGTVDEVMAFAKREKAAPAGPTTPVDITARPQTLPPVSDASQPKDGVDAVAVPDKSVTSHKEGPTVHSTSDDYRIGSGDTLQISVWKEPEASVPSVVVRPDGRITMPLIKEVTVGGLTPQQAEAAIVAEIGKFISDPSVTVVVAAINSKKIYLIGAVKKEGTLPYSYGMTVLQALSEASGLTDYAKRKKIYILRTDNGREYRLGFNYDEVVRGERMDQNVVLLPGDTVVIPH